jgi:hypothetical protein
MASSIQLARLTHGHSAPGAVFRSGWEGVEGLGSVDSGEAISTRRD